MLHELIMCLLGYVGGLFQLKIENNKTKIKLVENLDYLHPGEVEICNKLAELGNFYRQIIEFYDTYCFGKPIENKPLKDGMYLRAFCDAIDSVVLAPYRRVISHLEKDLLKDRYNNVTYLQTHLENYFCIFSALDNVINEITSKKLHGCQIVDLIYKYTISGNSEVKNTFNQILTINLNVMYKQLRDWMLYGNLYDKYGEFFICLMENNNKSASRTSSTSNLVGLSQTQSGDNNDNNIELEDIFLLGDRFTSSFTQYTLNSSQLPSFISLKTANKILFNGELLQLFKSSSASDDLLLESSISDTISMLNLSISAIQKTSSNKLLNEEFNVINKNMDELSKKIWSLSKQEYSNVKFDNLVTEIRNYASEAVWHLIVEKYNLLEEFQKLKDMYLIGRGELFATFLEASKSMLNKQVDQNFEYNINFMFQKSISRMLLDNEAWLSKFRVVLIEQNTEKKNQTGWNRIGLSYRVEWPFNSLITKRVLNKYNEIFNYLISIRRVQIELNQCFLLRMRLNGKHLTQTIDPKVWQTRNHMSFIIDNLQFYLQADVLETQFNELENNIRKSKDFEQIRFAHDTFLTRIQYQSFMINKTILVYLNSIMDLCLSFSSILLNYEDEANLKKNKESLQEITKNFQIQTSSLYKALRSIEKKQMGTYLEQLLTRINFNNYMEEHDGYL